MLGGGGGLCGFEEALADLNCALGVGSAFVPGGRGIDRVQADGGRVYVHGSLRWVRGQVEGRDERNTDENALIDIAFRARLTGSGLRELSWRRRRAA